MGNARWTVVSLGGSVIVPDSIDTEYLKRFATVIRSRIPGERFIIISGGGKTAREYQEAARSLGELSKNDLDWIGIHATRLNGHLLRSLFRAEAHPALIDDPTDPIVEADVVIAAGWQPGWSTDYVATKIAKNVGATRLVNISSVDAVYSEDPKKNPAATKFDTLSWTDFRALMPSEWDPGLNAPFDPVAAEEAAEAGIEVAIIGPALDEFEKYLSGKPFAGTRIQ
ncbi:UMP kinase [Patescibacteria group bacterium]|nr:UMP kinase [Patescibacteria group bacterium]